MSKAETIRKRTALYTKLKEGFREAHVQLKNRTGRLFRQHLNFWIDDHEWLVKFNRSPRNGFWNFILFEKLRKDPKRRFRRRRVFTARYEELLAIDYSSIPYLINLIETDTVAYWPPFQIDQYEYVNSLEVQKEYALDPLNQEFAVEMALQRFGNGINKFNEQLALDTPIPPIQ